MKPTRYCHSSDKMVHDPAPDENSWIRAPDYDALTAKYEAERAAREAADADRDTTPLRIENRGAPKIERDYAYSVKRGPDVVSFWIDLESKYCDIMGHGDSMEIDTPAIFIGAGEHSSYLDESVDRDDLTAIAFPEFAGWDVHCVNISKWTVAVCLTRRAAIEGTPRG